MDPGLAQAKCERWHETCAKLLLKQKFKGQKPYTFYSQPSPCFGISPGQSYLKHQANFYTWGHYKLDQLIWSLIPKMASSNAKLQHDLGSSQRRLWWHPAVPEAESRVSRRCLLVRAKNCSILWGGENLMRWRQLNTYLTDLTCFISMHVCMSVLSKGMISSNRQICSCYGQSSATFLERGLVMLVLILLHSSHIFLLPSNNCNT